MITSWRRKRKERRELQLLARELQVRFVTGRYVAGSPGFPFERFWKLAANL